MPFCPRCRCEYNVGVEDCIDCHVPLVLHRPQRRAAALDFDADELIVPFGSLLCALAGLGLFGISMMARNGQLSEPLGPMIMAQPVCLTGFYAVAAVLSGIVFAISVIRLVFFRG